MTAPITLDIDGFTFNESTDAWVFEDWSGWLGGVPVNVAQTDRTGHGVSTQPGRRGARLLWVSGWRAGPRAELAAAIETLEAMLADGLHGIFRAFDVDLGERWTPVQLTGTIDADWSDSRIVEYQFNLLASDPFKYGVTSSATTTFAAPVEGSGFVWPAFPDGVADWGAIPDQGTATIHNAGKAPSDVRFVVDGPTPDGGFQIVHAETGRALTFLSVVPAGSQLVIDGKTGASTLDGVADRSGALVVQSWPQIAADADATFTFEPLAGTSAATLTAETTATYW